MPFNMSGDLRRLIKVFEKSEHRDIRNSHKIFVWIHRDSKFFVFSIESKRFGAPIYQIRFLSVIRRQWYIFCIVLPETSCSNWSLKTTVLPTVADHKVTNGMGCQI